MVSVASRRSLDDVWTVLRGVPDPEIPVISIVDLGIVRGVRWNQEQADELVVTLTPTYSGCPATAVIADSVTQALCEAGVAHARIETTLSPAWTTDWLSEAGKERLAQFGIAPPGMRAGGDVRSIDISRLRSQGRSEAVRCPRCGSFATELLSRFGSTPCKAQYRCRTCAEPFDYFKPH